MAQPELYGRALNAIVDAFAEGRHQWAIPDPDEISTSRWGTETATWDSLLRELVEKTWRAALDDVGSSPPTTRILLVSVDPASQPLPSLETSTVRAQPARAREILSEPLYMVVENATSDWHFLRAMARVFQRDSVVQAMANGWLVPEHAGGAGDFLKRIDGLIGRGIVPWRIVALADSDRLAPGPLPEKVAEMAAKINSRGATAVVLFKREVENYLPDSAIDEKRNHDAWVSLLSLTRQQRDHFDMKSGFKINKDTQNIHVLAEQRELFARSNPWHLRRLVGGFGKHIGERFETAAITREEMVVVCETCPGEIEHILQTLEEAL